MILEILFDDLGVARLFKAIGKDDRSAWGVESRTIQCEGKHVLSLMNWL